MPTNHNNENNEETPRQPVPNMRKNTPVINVTINNGINQIENVDANADSQNANNRDVIVNIVNPIPDNSEQAKANDIAASANIISNKTYIINGGLFLFTIILAGVSIWQGCLTRQSVQLADSVFHATIAYNDKTYKQSRIDADFNDKREDRRDTNAKKLFNIQDSSLDAQIKSITEIQKQFKIGNEPYIQILSPAISGVSITTKIAIRINITNLGNYPIKMIYMQNLVGLQDSTYGLRFTNDKTFKVNTYLIKGDAFPLDVFDHRVLTQSQLTEIENGKRYVYLSGFIKYQNLITKEFKLYKYMFKFNGIKLLEVIKNDNEKFTK